MVPLCGIGHLRIREASTGRTCADAKARRLDGGHDDSVRELPDRLLGFGCFRGGPKGVRR
jgi:hypothetical protein